MKEHNESWDVHFQTVIVGSSELQPGIGMTHVNREAPCFLADALVVICEAPSGVQPLHSDTKNNMDNVLVTFLLPWSNTVDQKQFQGERACCLWFQSDPTKSDGVGDTWHEAAGTGSWEITSSATHRKQWRWTRVWWGYGLPEPIPVTHFLWQSSAS